MNPSQSGHAQTLIDWLINPHAITQAQADAARDAAAALAEAARAVTGTGPTGAQVLTGWDDLLEGCPGCPTCQPDPGSDPGNDDPDNDDQDDDQGDDQGDGDGEHHRPGAALSEADMRQLVAQGWLAPVAAGPAVNHGPGSQR